MRKVILLCVCCFLAGLLCAWLGIGLLVGDIDWVAKLAGCAYFERKDHALDMAIRQDNFKVAQAALRRGADPNAMRFMNGWTYDRLVAPHFFPTKADYGSDNIGCMAISQGDDKIVDLLIASGYRCDSSYDATQSLTTAIAQGHVSILRKLLDAGANPNVCDYDGGTPLMLAARKGDAEATAALLEHGAAPCARYIGSWCFKGTSRFQLAWITPIFYGVTGGNPEVVRLLLMAGASPNDRAKDGTTPLHLAAMLDKADVARILLEHGADPVAKDSNGHTAADVARECGSADVARLLRH